MTAPIAVAASWARARVVWSGLPLSGVAGSQTIPVVIRVGRQAGMVTAIWLPHDVVAQTLRYARS